MDVGDDLILGDKDDDMFGFMELEELDGSFAGEIFGAEAFARGEGAKASGGELVKSDKKGNKDEKGGKRGKGPVRVGGEPSPDVLAARVAELERENARLRRMSGSLDEDDGNGCGADAGKNARTSAAPRSSPDVGMLMLRVCDWRLCVRWQERADPRQMMMMMTTDTGAT